MMIAITRTTSVAALVAPGLALAAQAQHRGSLTGTEINRSLSSKPGGYAV